MEADRVIGTPISPYVYGQFIEHLGRGVYGGLWAEMLEDRKFFFIITDRYAPWGTTSDPNWNSGPYDYLRASPWKVIGPVKTVSMDTDAPFTGIHPECRQHPVRPPRCFPCGVDALGRTTDGPVRGCGPQNVLRRSIGFVRRLAVILNAAPNFFRRDSRPPAAW